MFIKYIVKRDNESVVVKYDLRYETVTVGGYVRFIALIHILTSTVYFGMVDKENTHTQKNKLRYSGKCPRGEFLEIIKRVSEDFSCETVKRVERLI